MIHADGGSVYGSYNPYPLSTMHIGLIMRSVLRRVRHQAGGVSAIARRDRGTAVRGLRALNRRPCDQAVRLFHLADGKRYSSGPTDPLNQLSIPH